MVARTVDDLYEDVRSLDDESRAELLRRILADAYGPPEEGVEEAWRDEVRDRVRAIREGKTKLRPWADVKADLERRRG